jgi:hypothetical protein
VVEKLGQKLACHLGVQQPVACLPYFEQKE